MELVHPKVAEHLAALARHSDPILEEMERKAEATDFPHRWSRRGQNLLHGCAHAGGEASL